MRLSNKAQYAVRAMVRLSLENPDEPVSSKTIADLEGISLTFLEQILSKLRKGKIVKSVRGPGGGFVLARSAQHIRVDEIIESVEEPLMPVACMDETGTCQCDELCYTHMVWAGLGQRIKNFLSSITLEELSRDASMIRQKARVQRDS